MMRLILLLCAFLSFHVEAQTPDYKNNPSFWINGNNLTPVVNLTPIVLVTAIPTPTGTPAAQSYIVTDFTATNSDGTDSTNVQLLEGATVKYECGATANSIPCTKDFDTPILFSPNADISARALTTSAAVRFSIQGYRVPRYTPAATPTFTPTATATFTATSTPTPTP